MAGLQFGQVEQIVEEGEETVAILPDLVKVKPQAIWADGRNPFGTKRCEAENAVQRGSQFVRDIGEKFAFCQVCHFSRLFGAAQFFLGLFALRDIAHDDEYRRLTSVEHQARFGLYDDPLVVSCNQIDFILRRHVFAPQSPFVIDAHTIAILWCDEIEEAAICGLR